MATGIARLEWCDIDTIQFAEKNPHLSDLGLITASIQRHGFIAPPIRDERTQRLVVGEQRIKSLRALKQNGQPIPNNIKVEDGKWYVQIVCGLSFETEAEAAAYLVDDNNLVLAGGDFSPFDLSKLWSEKEYLELMQQLAIQNELPLSVSGDDLDALLQSSGNKSIHDNDSTLTTCPQCGYQWKQQSISR